MRDSRMRRWAALLTIALALTGCGSGGDGNKAGAPTTTLPGSTETSLAPGIAAGAAPEATPGTGAGGGGATAQPGSAAATGGAPGSPGSSGGSVAVPGSGTTGGDPSGGTTATTAPAGGGSSGSTAPPAAGSGSSGGSSSAGTPTIRATPEECAALRQLMAIVDHPDLRKLAADTGC